MITINSFRRALEYDARHRANYGERFITSSFRRSALNFVSFSRQGESHVYDADKEFITEDEEDYAMDLDNEELYAPGGSKLTYPGETLTSTQEFMRCVHGQHP